MATQLKIVKTNIQRFTNALHASFGLALYEVITSLPAPDQKAWRIQPLLADWKASIDMEVEITREAAASADTIVLEELDKKRDAIISYIFEGIKYERNYGLIEARQKAAQRLYITSKTYKNLQREAYQEQTAQTIGLIGDLQKTQNFQDLKTLGLDVWISQLQTVNEEFKGKYATRSATRAQTKLPTAKEQRKISDDIYSRICERIQGSFIFVDTDAERERINFLVSLMNQRIEEHRARYNQATGQTTSKTDGGGKGGTNSGNTTKDDDAPYGRWPDGTPKALGE